MKKIAGGFEVRNGFGWKKFSESGRFVFGCVREYEEEEESCVFSCLCCSKCL